MDVGARHFYISNLPIGRAQKALAEILERVEASRQNVRTAMTRLTIAAALLMAAVLQAQPSKPAETPLDRLRASIERTTRSVNATWGIYVKSIETGEELAIDADRQMETMSTIKIPLMAEVFEQIKAGKIRLTDHYTYQQADMRGGTGVIRSLQPGAVLTVQDLVTLMIIVSDNTATDVLYRMVGGPQVVTDRMNAMGLTKTHPMTNAENWFKALAAAPSAEAFYRDGSHPFGLSTPREMGRLLEMMERGTLVDKPSSDLMLADHARPAVPDAHPALHQRLPDPAQDGRLPALRRRRRRRARSAGTDDRRQHLHGQSFRIGRDARERDRTGREGRRGLLLLSVRFQIADFRLQIACDLRIAD